MAEILLQTKLFVPPKRPFLISRPHLITKLNEGLMGKLTLASAPAGFGKTTLISTWLNQLAATHKTAWLSLDESDNDPVRFFAYFIGALQTVETAVGQSLANTSQLPPAEVAMQLLLPEITAVSHPFILVLDDDTSDLTTGRCKGIAHLVEIVVAQRDCVFGQCGWYARR